MALTIPDFTQQTRQCTVSVQSTDAGAGINLTLHPSLTDAWTDQELRDKVAALSDAFGQFLAPGQDVQVNVWWRLEANETVIRSQRTTA
ncbi:hypothetical protein [Streptomyces sp. NPDC058603]|uniref:hypothetical protein n=1 Tax=Streptomyces sp. NPDC058603 TaxID=3346551 RepID=UPI00365CEADE